MIKEFVGAFLCFSLLITGTLDLFLWVTFGYDVTISWVINQYFHNDNTHVALKVGVGFSFGILANHFLFKWAPGPNGG